mgnify:CR=1 FL=1
MGRQNRNLLNWLESHDGISTLEAMENLRICRLSERIREIEQLGFVIEHERDSSLNAHFVRYKLLRVAYG